MGNYVKSRQALAWLEFLRASDYNRHLLGTGVQAPWAGDWICSPRKSLPWFNFTACFLFVCFLSRLFLWPSLIRLTPYLGQGWKLDLVGVFLLPYICEYGLSFFIPTGKPPSGLTVILSPEVQCLGSFLLTSLLLHLQCAIYLIVYIAIRVMISICLLPSR